MVSLAGLGAKKLKTLTVLATVVLTVMVVGLFGTVVIFAYFSRELPNPSQLLERSFELSTRFYDRNDKLIYEVFGDKNRTLVKMEDVVPYVTYATLATEDSEFYLHKGYSIRGMARALRNTFTGEGLQGGSTLTQQVIKNTLLTQDRTLVRKIKELILSLQLENRYSKDEIIQMYLNETPYGGQNYGIYSASKAYFNKLPKDLTIAESAYLAGLPQSPSYYSQFGVSPEAGIERKNYVLYLMRERGWVAGDGKRHYLSQQDYDAARGEELKFETSRVPLEAPHFVFYAKQFLINILGEDAVEKGGLKVKTTVDLDVQKIAQETVTNELDESSASLNVWNGAMVVLDPKTGQILAMVGSKGYNLDSQPEGCIPGTSGENSCKFDPYVNVAISDRQPGSAIKPITYANMLAQGYSLAYPFLDMPISFEGAAPDKPYVPANYDGIFRGVVSLRRSLGNSLNIPAVEALKIGGIDNMIDLAEKMGITTFKDRQRYGLALTLGGGETKLLELTGAFSVFAAEGMFHRPVPIIEVQDSNGRVVYKPQEPAQRALDEGPAFLISDILSDNGARSDVFGTASLLNIPGHTVAVKTGTTDDKRDNYAIGYTPFVVVGVWVGNSNNEKMNPYIASGISGASPIWNTFIKEYLKD
ncbi:MAG: Penicillin-binding protein, 1A family, partial [candidate division WWE3 bacterium GW2011_GWD2_42_11]